MHEYHYAIILYEDQIARISFIMAPESVLREANGLTKWSDLSDPFDLKLNDMVFAFAIRSDCNTIEIRKF